MACNSFVPEIEVLPTGDYAVCCNGLFLTSLETEYEAAQLVSNLEELLEKHERYLIGGRYV